MSVPPPSVVGTMTQTHPWRTLRDQWPHVDLYYADLPEGTWGLSDGRTIWLSDTLSQAERRCTVMHEIVHMELGQHECQDPAVEAVVHREVARRLIPWERLASALLWARDELELADELWVDVETVQVRLEHLHPSERAKLRAMVAARAEWS